VEGANTEVSGYMFEAACVISGHDARPPDDHCGRHRLQRGSTMIGAGMGYRPLVPSPPTVDYFGNSIPAGALKIGPAPRCIISCIRAARQEAPVHGPGQAGRLVSIPAPAVTAKPPAQTDDPPAIENLRSKSMRPPLLDRSPTPSPDVSAPFPSELDVAWSRA
jgi:hypothetical protein